MKAAYEHEERAIRFLRRWSVPLLRISLGIVYAWFGALKLAGTSPVFGLIEAMHPEYPEPAFFIILGIWEILIGIGFLTGRFLRITLVLMWLQMGGIMIGLLTDSGLFFQAANPFNLTYDGEFLIKNLVLIAASLVVAGHGLQPRAKVVS